MYKVLSLLFSSALSFPQSVITVVLLARVFKYHPDTCKTQCFHMYHFLKRAVEVSEEGLAVWGESEAPN